MAKGIVTIEKLLGGMVTATTNLATASGTTVAVEGRADQFSYATGVSMFNFEHFGHLAPGDVYSEITDSGTYISALALNGDVASNNSFAYFVLNNGRLVQTTNIGTTTTNFVDVSPRSGSVQSNQAGDILIIKDGTASASEWILWSWEGDSTSKSDVAIIRTTTTGIDSSYLNSSWFSYTTGVAGSGYLTPLVPLKMCQGMDGNVYITNGQYVAQSVIPAAASIATVSTVSNHQALNLGAGWIASGIIPYRNLVAICGYRQVGSTLARSYSRMWLWDGFSPDPNLIYDIPDSYVKGLAFDGSQLLAFTAGRNNTGKIYRFNGQGFDLAFESPRIQMTRNPIQGSIDMFQDSIIWTEFSSISQGEVYQFYKGGMHFRTLLKDSGTATTKTGMAKNLYQGQMFFGGTFGGTNKVIYFASTGYLVSAKLRTVLYPLPWRSVIKKMRVYFSQFGTGASVTLTLFRDYSGSPLFTKTITNTTLGAVNFHQIDCEINDVNSFFIDILWDHAATTNTAAIIRKIEVEYETTNQ